MKKIFTKLMLLAVAAAALVSCDNKIDESTPVVELTQTVTLTAEKPVEVRTEMIEGVPYWSKGDAIGVYVDESKHYRFTNDAEEASLTTSFTGTTAVANTLFVYYPYTANGVAEKGAKVDLPANQEPTATSFDGKADIMLAKPVTLDAEGKQISDLEFARLGAIVKVVLKDNTSSLAGQHVSSLTMTAATNLTGRVYIDVVNQELGELYYGQSKSVNATYAEPLAINGENGVYVIVYPQTLAAGSTLSFEASTEGYAISKSITLPQDIVLESGKVTTLNVSLKAENLVKEEAGLALPFEDDFAWVTGTNENTDISASLNGEKYASGVKTYSANGALKFGSSSAAGVLTTVPLNLSEPFTVIIKAKNYGTDATKVNVTVGETTQTVTLTGDYAYYALEFEAASKKDAVTVASNADSKQRFYLDELQVVAGHDVVLPTLPPVLTVSKSEISVSHEAATETFTYSVANPVDGVNAAISDNATWISTSVSGTTVTVNVAENTAEEAREGVITVTYGDLTKTVTVNQAAKPAEGGNEGGVAEYVKVTTAQSDWSGTYLIVAGTKAATTVNGSWLQATAVSESNGVIASNATTDAIAVTIAKSGDNYTIKLSDGKYLKTTNSNSGLSAVATADSNSTWTFSIESGAAKIVWSGNSSRHLRLNGDSGFRTYTTATGTIATLYKLTGGNGGGSTPEPEPATPVLSINPTTLSFDAAAGSKTVDCTIENEVSGVNVTATESVDWLTTSVSGKTVTITATENTATTTRTATVTIAYTGAESKTVTVNQAAAEVTEPEQPGGGSTGGTFTETFANYKASLSSSATSYACSGSFAGVSENGITWSYTGCGNPGQTTTDITSLKSKGLTYDTGVTMGKSGTLSATIPGGATSVSFYILTSSKATCTVTITNASGATLKTQTVAKSTTGKVEITGINSNGGAITISFKEASTQNRVTVAGLEYTR